MTNRLLKRILIVIGVLLALFFFVVGGHFIDKNWHEQVKELRSAAFAT